MSKLVIKTNPAVEVVFSNYPPLVQGKMKKVRELVIETASEIVEISDLEEALRWGEPSFITKTGSTLRMDWKAKTPEQYALYFKCTSRLVETFKLVFQDTFKFEGNRAIVFRLDQKDLPEAELKKCIRAALTYHKVKNLITLGI